MDAIPWFSMRYCARQDAAALLELWALLLVLAGAAVALLVTARRRGGAYPSGERLFAGALALLALLTGAVAASMMYGCTMTAAAEQGLGSDLPAHTYTLLRCLNFDVGFTVGWTFLVGSLVAAMALLGIGIVRRSVAVRVLAFGGSGLALVLAFGSVLALLFGFSWCTSQRLF